MLNWLQGLINEQDKEKDVKLLAFGSVVAAAIAWLTREQFRAPITDQWVNAFYGLCALVGLGGSAWALVDKIKGKQDAPSIKTEGTENEERTSQ